MSGYVRQSQLGQCVRLKRVECSLFASQTTRRIVFKTQARSFKRSRALALPYRSNQSSRHDLPSKPLPIPILASCALALILWSYHQRSTTLNDAPPAHNKALELPINTDDSVSWTGMVFPALDLVAANTKLKAEETSIKFNVKRDTSVTRFDSVRIASNSPCEDEKSYAAAHVGEAEDWKLWGVYDGHAGWATSQILRNCLSSYVARSLREAKLANPPFESDTIDNAIKLGFLKLDNEIISDGLKALTDPSLSHAEALSRIIPAQAGSCALLAIFDPVTAKLRVACTGDSRAVLGRRDSSNHSSPSQNTTTTTTTTTTNQQSPPQSNNYTALPLSVDQTGFNESEVTRINTQHPDEPKILDSKSGRLLGLAVTRAFGDHRWKWPLSAIETARANFYSTSPRPNYASPPYLTAEPEIITTQIHQGDFLILASDGFWDHVSSDYAVECVSRWLEWQQQQQRGFSTPSATATELSETTTKSNTPFSWEYKASPVTLVVEDTNAATHLARNALGGRDRELFCSAMSTQAPHSRNVRDDITIQVVFFGDVLQKKFDRSL